MAEKFLLKDHLFNKAKIQKIGDEIHQAYPAFKKDPFISTVLGRFPELELKARISWIADCLKRYLPDEYTRATKILVKALPAPNDPSLSDDDFGDFIYATYAEYVAKNGCSKKYLDTSMAVLYAITQRFSAEDAIRYFINAFPNETLKHLRVWSTDPHYHVRRLCSEGTRPKLPWSQKISIPITATIPLLDILFSDSTRFVTRSVANHINDISKVNPELALRTLAKWKRTGKQQPAEMDFIIRHALRTLVKNGNPQALKLLGISHEADVHVAKFTVPKEVKMGTALAFSVSILANEDSDLIVDYIVYFQGKTGKQSGKKVFKLKRVQLAKGAIILLSKKHVLREDMTTRKLFRGRHGLEIQINGKPCGKKVFDIV